MMEGETTQSAGGGMMHPHQDGGMTISINHEVGGDLPAILLIEEGQMSHLREEVGTKTTIAATLEETDLPEKDQIDPLVEKTIEQVIETTIVVVNEVEIE